jgi:hypothetical protein
MMENAVNVEKDLPLMANSHDIRVRHYMMRLAVDFNQSVVTGQSILFVENLVKADTHIPNRSSPFQCVLDCRHLDIFGVFELVPDDSTKIECIFSGFEKRRNLSEIEYWINLVKDVKLDFVVEPWCVRVSKEDVTKPRDFPRVLKICWRTRPEGKSLMWRKDQDGNPCVFTPAAAVNNRSLFPCQEPPIAMASWQCLISVVNDTGMQYQVLCTGDQNAELTSRKEFYFYTQMVLPMSTFAVAIGKWAVDQIVNPSIITTKSTCLQKHEPYPCHVERGDVGPIIPCRLIGPESLVCLAKVDWSVYIPACLTAAYDLLGPHPFCKLDIVILPRCYSGLGLASPSLMFVSPSIVLNCDGAMMLRLAHEVSHSWFGLLIGALDWTEEWLSEVIITVFYYPSRVIHN